MHGQKTRSDFAPKWPWKLKITKNWVCDSLSRVPLSFLGLFSAFKRAETHLPTPQYVVEPPLTLGPMNPKLTTFTKIPNPCRATAIGLKSAFLVRPHAQIVALHLRGPLYDPLAVTI